LVKFLTQDGKQVAGGQLSVETDAVKAADAMLGDIVVKKERFDKK
jgi:hydroxylamine reductase (hybrid-cluster protein)